MTLYVCKRRHRTSPDWHYYIQDYMGNVRMVMNSDGTVEQQNHYYPYGGIIGNLSTNQDLQAFKFEGKVLAAIERAFLCSWREDEALAEGQDRQFGLDWYDIHARQYDAIGVPSWNKVDALAEENPHLSPYVFAGGNPVNFGDYDGNKVYLFATQLPGTHEALSIATHTFIVVKGTNGEETYAVYAPKNDDWWSGNDPLVRLDYSKTYSDDRRAIRSYFDEGKQNDRVKNVFEIEVPEGMTSDSFDQKVIETINSFGNNPGIRYALYPFKPTEGNCNSSTSTILMKSGVSTEYIKEIDEEMKGINWGFSTTIKAWTENEQQNAVEEYIKRIEALQKSLQ